MWHSLAHSFSEIKNLGIGDTYHESFNRYSCRNHEKEILKEFLESDVKENLIIHVHAKINLSDLDNIDLVIFGKRDLFTWRTSRITWCLRQLRKRGTQFACTHTEMCTKKHQLHYYYLLVVKSLRDSPSQWRLSFSPKNNFPKYNILSYDQDAISQTKLGNRIKELVCEDSTAEFILRRYGSANSDLKIKGPHDSVGLPLFFGTFINILTFPPFLAFESIRRLKTKKLFF